MIWKDFWEMTCNSSPKDMVPPGLLQCTICTAIHGSPRTQAKFPRKRRTQCNHRKRNRYVWWLSVEGSSFWSKSKKHQLRLGSRDFPSGAVVKNPPVKAGDMGPSTGSGRSHMPRSNEPHMPQLLSLCATTTEAHTPRARAPQQEKPPQWEARAPQRRVAPTHCN